MHRYSTSHCCCVLDAFKPYLTRRWNEGCTNAAQLHAELQAQGWSGSLRTVQGHLRPFRAQQAAPAAPAPKPRHVVTWIMSDPEHLAPDERVRLIEVLTRCPELEAAAGQVREFAKTMTHRRGHRLEAWITTTAAGGGDPHLAGFAEGLRRDQAAVTAGLTLPYSSRAVEGAVNKIKMIKRKMFGRAGLDLLPVDGPVWLEQDPRPGTRVWGTKEKTNGADGGLRRDRGLVRA